MERSHHTAICFRRDDYYYFYYYYYYYSVGIMSKSKKVLKRQQETDAGCDVVKQLKLDDDTQDVPSVSNVLCISCTHYINEVR